jgi:hypothetical protein
VILPASITSKQVIEPDGTEKWVAYDTGRMGSEPLKFIATDDKKFPPHLFLEPQGDGVLSAIWREFSAMGFTNLPLEERVQIESAVAAAMGASTTLRGAEKPVPIWEGRVAYARAVDLGPGGGQDGGARGGDDRSAGSMGYLQ